MKTKLIINRLNELDPTGEKECCVNNMDISFIELEPAYYDGCLQVIVRENERVKEAKYISEGSKIVFHPISITDLIADHPDIPVNLSGLSEERQERYGKRIEEVRKAIKDMNQEIEKEFFVKYTIKRLAEMTGECQKYKYLIEKFFDENFSWKDPLSSDYSKSYVERREQQWGESVILRFDGLNLILEKKNG